MSDGNFRNSKSSPDKLYTYQMTGSSFCPVCKECVGLLVAENCCGPAFWICFDCEWVGQAGVGVVKEGK